MKAISRVGIPFYNFSLEKQEWKKGEKIGGFTVPFNVFDSAEGLFRRFGLWQSSKGVCMPGKNHEPFWIGHYTMQTRTPVLVGDRVLGESVLESECDYLDRFGLWECRVEYGDPPDPSAKEQEIDLLKAYADTDEQIAQGLIELMGDFLSQVVSACTVQVGGAPVPVSITAALPAFELIKGDAQQEIAQKIKELREKLWH